MILKFSPSFLKDKATFLLERKRRNQFYLSFIHKYTHTDTDTHTFIYAHTQKNIKYLTLR